MAITYRFVQLMKGRISVESTPGEGAKFTVLLPTQVVVETPEAARSQARAIIRFGAEQVLVPSMLRPAKPRVEEVAS